MALTVLSFTKAAISIVLCSLVLAKCTAERRAPAAKTPTSLAAALLAFSCILTAFVIGHWLALFLSDVDITAFTSLLIITVDVIQINLCGISFGYYASPNTFRDFAYAYSIIALILSFFGAFVWENVLSPSSRTSSTSRYHSTFEDHRIIEVVWCTRKHIWHWHLCSRSCRWIEIDHMIWSIDDCANIGREASQWTSTERTFWFVQSRSFG